MLSAVLFALLIAILVWFALAVIGFDYAEAAGLVAFLASLLYYFPGRPRVRGL